MALKDDTPENERHLTITEKRLINVEKDLTELKKTVNSTDKKVDMLVAFLKGNNELGDDEGFIKEMKEVKERVSKMEKLIDRLKWVTVGMSIPAGYGFFDFLKKIAPFFQ